MSTDIIAKKRVGRLSSLGTALVKYKFLYLMVVPALAFTFVFAYLPMSGLIVAFKDYDIWQGIMASPWAGRGGFAHFIAVFTNRAMLESIGNTIYLSLLNLAISFPAPIIFALLLNELRQIVFKRVVQTVSYMPHFLSWISVIGITMVFFGQFGPLNEFFLLLNPEHTRRLFLAENDLFVPLLVFLNLWKTMGFQSIIFLAAITGVDPQLYEAASIDGAGRFKQALYVTIPAIMPTVMIMFILQIGGILASNFELVFGMQNVFIDFEVIDTVVYRHGLLQRGYSQATALGLTRGLIALGLTVGVNQISKKLGSASVF